MSTRTSKASSTPARTSSPTELLRALFADDFPGWAPDPLHELIAARLRVTPRAAKEALAPMRVSTSVALHLLGRLDETWLFRVPADAALVERVRDVDGVASALELDAPFAIVRTCAADAVAREKLLRALHAKLGERPLAQLHRPLAAPPKRPSREEWALVRALRRHPWGAPDVLAKEAGMPAKSAKERLARLASERVVTLDTTPADAPLARVLVRSSPSSTAAAARAFDAVEGLVRAWLPREGEVSYADALVLGKPDLSAARDVPGVASVDLLPVRAMWQNDALVDDLLRRAG